MAVCHFRRRACLRIRTRFVCNILFFSLFIVFCISCILLYKVQYQTGIELLPFVPIDDSGFEYYNEQLLEKVEVSEAANRQAQTGFLFCWVMSASIYHGNRVVAVNETWLHRCDAGHIFTNSAHGLDDSIPYHTIFEALPDSYFKLFWKSRLALFYIYSRVSSRFDWYFKADDDTYVIVETLKEYLSQFDPGKPLYIGYRLKRRMPEHGYNSGGSGYILSRAAMKEFANSLFHNRQACPYHEWEDYGIARCLGARGIYPVDSRDSLGRQRFLPWRPEEHFNADLTHQFIYDPIEHKGFEIFHSNLISLHHLNPDEIRLVDGILYRVAKSANHNGTETRMFHRRRRSRTRGKLQRVKPDMHNLTHSSTNRTL